MFGFGNTRRQTRNDTFGPSRIKGAALAGLGMLAWRWWRNRQAASPTRTSDRERSFSESSTPASGRF
jgi:hypothetical protein